MTGWCLSVVQADDFLAISFAFYTNLELGLIGMPRDIVCLINGNIAGQSPADHSILTAASECTYQPSVRQDNRPIFLSGMQFLVYMH